MAIWDNFRNAIRAYDDEYMENEEPEAESSAVYTEPEEAETEYSESRSRVGVFSRREARATFSDEPVEKVSVGMLIMMQPTEYGEAVEIADNLKAKRPVFLNLEHTDPNTARRLLDFLSGLMYALGGKITKASSRAYMLTPKNVVIAGDGISDFENSGLEF